ncbi:MAG: DUF2953 domain-containing protein [Candidatus Neomarinimicrobiota bacterium]|nr:DUF2953 domain-containing protein [Candidatus Neomarinimicrobiota bacterium]
MSTLITILVSIIVLLCLRWTVAISGRLNYDEKLVDYSVFGLVGTERFGIGFEKDRDNFTISLGGRQRKLFSFDLSGGKKGRKTEKLSTESKPKKSRYLNYLSMASTFRRSVRWKGLKLTGEFGFKNPAWTGKLFGSLMAIGNGLYPRRFHLNIRPNFDKQMARMDGTTLIQLCPALLAWRVGKIYFGFNR